MYFLYREKEKAGKCPSHSSVCSECWGWWSCSAKVKAFELFSGLSSNPSRSVSHRAKLNTWRQRADFSNKLLWSLHRLYLMSASSLRWSFSSTLWLACRCVCLVKAKECLAQWHFLFLIIQPTVFLLDVWEGGCWWQHTHQQKLQLPDFLHGCPGTV